MTIGHDTDAIRIYTDVYRMKLGYFKSSNFNKSGLSYYFEVSTIVYYDILEVRSFFSSSNYL